ncbi:MAG: RagB/SusD family nutrient uptake outer membrane protein [Muribaculaceae bacterium]|nr:RagB/SusD family nutrient uptake outer membrane protein [Muribaculaceae bacterium]
MKKIYILGAAAALAFSMASCNDFLEDNRNPLSIMTANPEFWSNPVNVEGQCNAFYNNILGYGSGTNGTFYFKTLNDDQAGAISSEFANWTFTTVPSSSSYWNDPYIEIRRANLIIQGVTGGTLNETVEGRNYLGIARLNRAMQYFTLVKRYGDVPLVTEPLEPTNDAELFGPRTARNTVMDFALEDIKYACENISTVRSKTTFSQDMAKAFMVEFCLFEGTYARYNQKDEERAKNYLNLVVSTAGELLQSYPVGNDYKALYNSISEDLAAQDEVIMMKAYAKDIMMNAIMNWTLSSSSVCGITKDAFDSFLFVDGMPLYAQADKNDAGVAIVTESFDGGAPSNENHQTVDISSLLSVRDKRLSAIVFPVLMYENMRFKYPNTMDMTSRSGYGVAKFQNTSIDYDYAGQTGKNYIASPIFWGARINMAYLEARAELGTISDSDITSYLAPLYSRAGLPVPTKASLESISDPANDMAVSNLLWELRRCRRCEFMLDDDIRYWDLVRWHQLDKLDFAKNPDIALGANVSIAPVAPPRVKNGYYDVSGGMTRTFSEREYFWPIPSEQITLSKNKMTQNPGWE